MEPTPVAPPPSSASHACLPPRGSFSPSVVRTFFREAAPDYGNYRFPYTQMAEIESCEDLDMAYAEGFLPASSDPRESRSLFYRARSLRLDLGILELDKKRRYLQRRGTTEGLTWSFVDLDTFLRTATTDWKERTLAWVAARHHPPFMDPTRLAHVMSRPYLRSVAVIQHDQRWIGLVLVPQGKTCAHYWFCFFDPECLPAHSLGKWILGETAARMKAQGHQYLYLGTVYGNKSRYKFQGIAAGVQFFDGNAWSSDLVELDQRLSTDP